MTNEQHDEAVPGAPEVGHLSIPLWVKMMWLGGMAWVLWYIIFGMQSQPDTWAESLFGK